MTVIIGLSGSLRKGSFNTALLHVAAEVAPAGCTVRAESIRGIPLYDADLEASDPPAAVTDLQAKIEAADGLLLVSPEYNQSIPGVFKNAIDWLSSFPLGGDKIFRGLPVGLVGVSAMWSGTLGAQTAWLPVFRRLAMKPYMGATLYVGGARDKFDVGGSLTDSHTREALAGWMAGFADFVAANAKG
ncbi:MAG: NAD(P)H-dependent oxidoreductase [Alphaproteobacteria bacterium]|nr:NAD(P)H-dependent oxidoreductase [Alphaproteobacteria bacterium]